MPHRTHHRPAPTPLPRSAPDPPAGDEGLGDEEAAQQVPEAEEEGEEEAGEAHLGREVDAHDAVGCEHHQREPEDQHKPEELGGHGREADHPVHDAAVDERLGDEVGHFDVALGDGKRPGAVHARGALAVEHIPAGREGIAGRGGVGQVGQGGRGCGKPTGGLVLVGIAQSRRGVAAHLCTTIVCCTAMELVKPTKSVEAKSMPAMLSTEPRLDLQH